jgi:hypothetical protein
MVRTYARRPKRRRPVSSSDEDSSSSEEEEAPSVEDSTKILKDWVVQRDRDPTGTLIDESCAYYESNLGFCCTVCHCPRKRRKLHRGDEYVQQAHNSLWHRKCCHNLPVGPCSLDWLTPLTKAQAEIQKYLENPENDCTTVKKSVVEKKYKDSKRLESELYNDDENVGKAMT